jgi:hypothetical protein
MKLTNVTFIQPAMRMIAKDLAEFTEDWRCSWERDGQKRNLFVPAKYFIDGMSVPRFAWTVLGITPFGAGNAAAGSHDPLYRARGGAKPEAWKGCTLTDEAGETVTVGRNETDRLMQEILLLSWFNPVQSGTAYRIVTTFGTKHWGGPVPALRG